MGIGGGPAVQLLIGEEAMEAVTVMATGLFFPFFLALQFVWLMLPGVVFQWWDTEAITTISVASIDMVIEIARQGSNVIAFLILQMYPLQGIVTLYVPWVYELTLSPYVCYFSPSVEAHAWNVVTMTRTSIYHYASEVAGSIYQYVSEVAVSTYFDTSVLSVRALFPMPQIEFGYLRSVLHVLLIPLEMAFNAEVLTTS